MTKLVNNGTKRVVVIGGGYAGLHAAKRLNSTLGGQSNVELVLIDKSTLHVRLTEIHEVAGGRIESDAVVNLIPAYAGKHVNFIQDTVENIDFKQKLISTKGKQTIKYSHLILALGSQPEFFGISGMKENAFTLWSLEDAETIREHILEMFKKADAEKDAETRKQMLTFVVGGGGFTGVELVGEIALWVERLCQKHSIDKKDVSLYIIEAMPTILPNLRASLVVKARRFMEGKGIKILTNSPIVEVSEDGLKLKSGETIKTKTLIWSGGVQANEFCGKLGLELGKRNRIKVNEYLQVPDYPEVYAIGDCCWFITQDGKPLPALVEAGMQAADCAADNVTAQIKGGTVKKFKPNLHGVMVSIGDKYAVADAMGMAFTGLPAMWFKHLVNIHYLHGVGGSRPVKEYMHHQFRTKHYQV
jgi:NADH dehydrogenase